MSKPLLYLPEKVVDAACDEYIRITAKTFVVPLTLFESLSDDEKRKYRTCMHSALVSFLRAWL